MRTLTVAIMTIAAALSVLQTRGEGGSEERRRTVLIELFTSEGCSSCPRAEELLPELAGAVSGVEVIPLAFHVDYWNYLGWRDRFSSPDYSRRQRGYADSLGTGVFTPQLVVDGVTSVVGSDRRGALRQIEKAAARPKGELAIKIQERHAEDGVETITLEVLGRTPDNLAEGEGAEIFLAVVEDGLISEIARGENAGRRLKEEAVVRQLVPLGAQPLNRRIERSFAVRLDREWNPRQLRYVAWIQTRDTRAVTAVAQTHHPAN